MHPVASDVPVSVTRCKPFTVSVRTYGGECLEQGDTKVEVKGLEARVAPFDILTISTSPNFACSLELAFYSHTAELRFDVLGKATIHFVGVRYESGGAQVTEARIVKVR